MITRSGILIQCASRISAGCARRPLRRFSAVADSVDSIHGGAYRSGVVARVGFRPAAGCGLIVKLTGSFREAFRFLLDAVRSQLFHVAAKRVTRKSAMTSTDAQVRRRRG